MSETAKIKCVSILALLFVGCMVLSVVTCVFANQVPLAEDAAVQENVLYYNDFSQDDGGLGVGNVAVNDGAGTIVSNDYISIPFQPVESNNYAISFDMKFNNGKSTNVYVHLLGLDGTKNSNIFLTIMGGTYFRLSDTSTNDLYTNSGHGHGVIDSNGVSFFDNFVNVKLVHFDGYVELWVGGTRRLVSHLSAFGNNMYNTRSPIEEGKITGLLLNAENSNNAVVIDNLKVLETVGSQTYYTTQNDSQNTDSWKTMPMSAENLYRENFATEASFVIQEAAGTYFPQIRLFGLNASLHGTNQKEYSVDVQTTVTDGVLTPYLIWQNEMADMGAIAGTTVDVTNGDTVIVRAEVYGDNIVIYVNDQKVIMATTYQPGGAYWKDFSYRGFEGERDVVITASDTEIFSNTEVTLKAELFGERETGFAWYIDGKAVEGETGENITLSELSLGEHIVQYKNQTLESNVITINVVDRRIVISGDKSEFYPTESVKFTADVMGDFSEETLLWYVNDVPTEETSDTLILSGLVAGTYTVVYKCDSWESNTVTITVLESNVTISSEKNIYLSTETASFTASCFGITEGAVFEWYVDGKKQDSTAEAIFTMSLAEVGAGNNVTVYAVVDGIKSNEARIVVAYDVLEEISADENFKETSRLKIEEGGMYGAFIVGTADDGTLYLYSNADGEPTYWDMSLDMPHSVNYVFEYKLFVPEDIEGAHFLFPCFIGMNTMYPTVDVEMAVEVNAMGLRPYIKDQGPNEVYYPENYGFGKDLSYEGGISLKGDWNAIQIAVSGRNIAVYINGEMVIYMQMNGATIPSGIRLATYPSSGGVCPVWYKDILIKSVVEPVPDLTGVSVSISSLNVKVGEKVTALALLSPYNAQAQTVIWYVNGEKVGDSQLTFEFIADTEGDYKIVCEVNGIKSAEKTVTVTGKGSDGGNDVNGCKSSIAGISFVVSVLVFAVIVPFVITRKKNSDR